MTINDVANALRGVSRAWHRRGYERGRVRLRGRQSWLRRRTYRRGYSYPIFEEFDVFTCGECNMVLPSCEGADGPELIDCDCPDGDPMIIHSRTVAVRVIYE